MTINISPTSILPIYEQIKNQIKDAIIKGDLHIGDALPSIRSLAKDLQISVITTKRAYDDLEQEGLIESVPGRGFFVCTDQKEYLKEKQMAMFETRLAELIRECKQAKVSLPELQEMVEILYKEGV